MDFVIVCITLKICNNKLISLPHWCLQEEAKNYLGKFQKNKNISQMKIKPCEQENELGRYNLEFNKKGNEITQKLLKLKS